MQLILKSQAGKKDNTLYHLINFRLHMERKMQGSHIAGVIQNKDREHNREAYVELTE